MASLTSTLFSWSLHDIYNDTLYKHKVKKIPESFESVESYLGSFVYPLLEETRAQLLSSMEIMYRAPFAEVEVADIRETEVDDFGETEPNERKVYKISVKCWRNCHRGRSKEPYKTLPGDFMILANAKPESPSDLERAGSSWAYLSVNRVFDNGAGILDDFSCSEFEVEASRNLKEELETCSSLTVVQLENLTSNIRMWKALHMSRNPVILDYVLSVNSMVRETCDSCSVVDDGLVKSLTSALNESQREAVLGCGHMLCCNEDKPGIELIWGPPGTGKTKTTATILVSLLKMRRRTLVCAPTNVAISELVSRGMKIVAASADNGASLSSFGDIILFGNKERLKVGSETQEVFLEYRVQKLVECLGPFGLLTHITSVISFLENCVSWYHTFKENSLIRKKNESTTKQDKEKSSKIKPKSFIEYVRERFVSIVMPLRQNIAVFCTHVPKHYIFKQNFENMVSLTMSLDSLERFLFKESVVSKDFEELSTKSDCISLLRCLERSLEELELPSSEDTDKITKFCFESASLVFSTVSSSFKLHKMRIKPITVLVIDEAAQLKECESAMCLQLPGIKHVVLVGDECQLPATVTSELAEEACFGRSLFERLSSQNHPKHLLNTQYRMHPSISRFPNLNFYDNQIQDATMVQRESYERHYLPGSMFGPYCFLNVRGGREEKDDAGHSRLNMVEAAVVLNILHGLHKAWLGSQDELSIGVVSPYAAQVNEIQDKMGKKYEKLDGFQVKVKTVDGFQGGEEDIVIVSTVRSYGQSLEFISSPQRVNVSLTRARHCLWILGNERTLTSSQSIWGEIVNDAKRRGCFFNADDDKGLAKAVLEAKKHVDQLDDLFNSESPLFKSSKWVVHFSDVFLKSFKKLPSVRLKKLVVNFLLKLAGGWRPKWPVLASNKEGSLEISKFKVKELFVVSTIDVVKLNSYKQILKIWDVLPLERTSVLINRLDALFRNYTDEFIVLCNRKAFEGNLVSPIEWPLSEDVVRVKDIGVSETRMDSPEGGGSIENSKVSDSLSLMRFYKLSHPTVNHMLSDRDDGDLDLPFEVTDQELEIILFPRSTFILGRSGTGKTTVLTHKLFQREKLHLKATEELCGDLSSERSLDHECSTEKKVKKICVLRQLFVTVSPKLCNAVKKQVSDFKSFVRCDNNADKSGSSEVEWIADEEAQFKNIPDTLVNIEPNAYPLVITYRKFLMMLDGTVGKTYFERFGHTRNQERSSTRSIALQTFLRTKEVNYDKFSVSYWPHINSRLTKNLEPSSVFTEIISHIKGGQKALDSLNFKLGRDEYVKMSERSSIELTGEIRGNIYDIFQMYEKMKMENGEFDQADFVIDLHSRLRHEIYEGDRIDFVYIDEVQDLTMSQIALFKHVCGNAEEGFVFSGDTAQTIARGVDFRFQDIKNLFYKKFLYESRGVHEDRTKKGRMSPLFSLSQNFRTHAGILKLSQSIIELLYHFFPRSMDVLEPEMSTIKGEAPVWLQCGNNENAMVKVFGNAKDSRNSFTGFGAEQVILVRNESSRDEVSSLVGNQALLLTILECKGLEFEDVLLFNFFGSSPLQSQWRVVYKYMKEQNMFDSESPSCPEFSESRHKLLCSELKQLYVAVTRTKQRLWICESTDVAEPMLEYWKKKCVVQERQLDDSFSQAIRVESSPQEWRSRGIKLYSEKNFDSAMMCFERAQDKYWARMSKASGLKAMADSKRTSEPYEANCALRTAAEIFEDIGNADMAANCYTDLGEYERAGRIYLEKFGDTELARAAECFSLARCYKLAAEVYAKGSFYSKCLDVCSKGKLFEWGLDYINEWKRHSKSSRSGQIERVEHEYLQNGALHYHEAQNTLSMMSFVRAFKSMDSVRGFLRPLGYLDELISLEIESGNLLEAANIAKARGDALQLADVLGKAQKYKDAASIVLFYVLAKSLWSPGKGWPLKEFEHKEELLKKAKLLAKNDTENFYEFVCVEVDIISNSGSDLATFMNQMIASQKHQSLRGEIISNKKILKAHLSSEPSTYLWEEQLVPDMKEHSEGIMFQNRVSVISLIYFWDSWKDKIGNVFECLGFLESQGTYQLSNYAEFCLNFLGVWRQFHNLEAVYLLLSSDADWARRVSKISSWNNGKLASISVRQLASSARAYWSSDVLSVGIMVLEKLKTFYSYQTAKNCSQFCESRIHTFIYEVSSYLSKSKHLSLGRNDQISRTLHASIKMAAYNFVSHAIPSDRQGLMTLAMACLREKDISKKLLTQFLVQYVGTGDLSYQRAGNIAMVILGSGGIGNQVYEMIKGKLEWNKPWKVFLDSLGGSKGHLPLRRFLDALVNTFYVDMRTVQYYISPHCFLYLAENLLNQTASMQGFIVTTKSSFIEWLMCRDETVPHLEGSSEQVHEFLINAITEVLVDQRGLAEWTGKKHENELPVLVTRMVVIFCLLQANFGTYLDSLFFIIHRDDIVRQLPLEFRDAILKDGNDHFLSAISKAFMKIDNPLVIADLGGNCPTSCCSSTVFLDMKVESSKDDVLRTLFRKAHECSSESLSIEAAAAEEARDSCSVTDTGSETVSDSSYLETNKNSNAEALCNLDGDPPEELSAAEEALVIYRVTDSGTENISLSTCSDNQKDSNVENTPVSCKEKIGFERDDPTDSGCFSNVFEAIYTFLEVYEHGESSAKKLEVNVDKYPVPKIPINTKAVEDRQQLFNKTHELKQSYAQKIKVLADKFRTLLTGDVNPKTPMKATEDKDVNEFVDMLEELQHILSTLDTSERGVTGETTSIKELCKRLQSRRAEMERVLSQLGSTGGVASGEASSQQDCGAVSENDLSSEESSPKIELKQVISKDNKNRRRK